MITRVASAATNMLSIYKFISPPHFFWSIKSNYLLDQCYAKCSSWIGRMAISQGLVRIAESQVLTQTYCWTRNLQVRRIPWWPVCTLHFEKHCTRFFHLYLLSTLHTHNSLPPTYSPFPSLPYLQLTLSPEISIPIMGSTNPLSYPINYLYFRDFLIYTSNHWILFHQQLK